MEPCVKSQQHLLKATEMNPMPTQALPPCAALSGQIVRQHFVTMIIGLPLRGKAHLSRRLKLYLEFFHGYDVGLFDVNNYVGPGGDDRLLEDLKAFFEFGGEASSKGGPSTSSGSSSGSSNDKRVYSGRFVILYVSDTYMALPSTWSGHSKWQRFWIARTLEEKLKAQMIFVEIQVDDSKEHRQDYIDRLERSRGSPVGAIARNVSKYAQHYVTIQDDGTEDDLTYMKLINYNHKVVTNNMMSNSVGSRIAQFLASAHPYKRIVYLSRHGESEYNVQKKLGGDSSLSPLGREYAPRLAEFAELVICGGAKSFQWVTLGAHEVPMLAEHLSRIPPDGQTGGLFAVGEWTMPVAGMRLIRWQLGYGTAFQDSPNKLEEVVRMANKGPFPVTLIFVEGSYNRSKTPACARLWTSSLRRTRETASYIRHPIVKTATGRKWEQMSHRVYRNLDEVFAGDFEGFTYEEIKRVAPQEAELRKMDKLGYRYPRGESYYDIIARLDLAMQHLEAIHEPTLVIGHQAVHRLVYAFLTGKKREHAIELEIPLHTVIKLEYDGTGAMQETRFFLGPKRLDEDDGQKHF